MVLKIGTKQICTNFQILEKEKKTSLAWKTVKQSKDDDAVNLIRYPRRFSG